MKKEIEKLLVFLIPAIIMQKILAIYYLCLMEEFIKGGVGIINTARETFENLTSGNILTLLNSINAFQIILPLLVIAVWVWKAEIKSNGRPALWALGALFLNYWILLLYIGHRIYDTSESNKTA